MTRLWILRHAKAADAGPRGDHSRPLSGRGVRQAEAVRAHVGEIVAAGEPAPTLALSSDAVRARQTADLVAPALPGARRVDEAGLYGADVDDVVERLHRLDGGDAVVLVAGHNPTLEELAWSLVDPADDAGRAQLTGGLATGALVVLDLDAAAWADVGPGTGRLVELFVPTSA